jgi:hypothetical protein
VRWVGMIVPEVALDKFHTKTNGDIPDYVGFLAAMVLAAQQMEREETNESFSGGDGDVVAQHNYFFRLRQVLGLEEKKKRPEGLGVGDEADLWKAWNRWLLLKGRESTAEEGEGSSRYISYPLSQSMLRDGDKNHLARLLWEDVAARHLSRSCDRPSLLGWMIKHQSRFHLPRLWQLLDRGRSLSRYEATADTVFDIYCSIDWDEDIEQYEREAEERIVRRLMAGLYREEDPISGDASYCLYPRQPGGWSGEMMEVEFGKMGWQRLRPERFGWCMPLDWGPVPPAGALTLGIRVEGEGTPLQNLKQLIFPKRHYWILIADPLSTGSVAFANWGNPVLNRPFVLLCHPSLGTTVDRLKADGLLTWYEANDLGAHDNAWREYVGCRILTADWPELGLNHHHAELAEDLQPRSKALLYTIDGLRVPHDRDCWLQGYPPCVQVLAAPGQVTLFYEELAGQKRYPLGEHAVNAIVSLPRNLPPGFYHIGGKLSLSDGRGGKALELPSRRIEIRSWDRLTCRAEALAVTARSNRREVRP